MPRPLGVSALSLFFITGAVLAGIAALSLAFPGSPLEPMWRLNPRGHQGLVRLSGWGVLGMATASVGCAIAGIGLWRHRHWGFVIAIVILVVQLAGDVLNVWSGAEPRAIIGVPIVATLLVYLSKASVKSIFRNQRHVATN